LLLLKSEGLVVRQAHRGTSVAELSLEDAEEIYSLRLADALRQRDLDRAQDELRKHMMATLQTITLFSNGEEEKDG
jgi:DNA-binding GntR family transcriptional regulator